MPTYFAIVAKWVPVETRSTGRPSFTMTTSGAGCIAPICAIAFMSPNGSSEAAGITGPVGFGGASPGGGARPADCFAAAGAFSGAAFFNPRRAFSSLMSRVPGRFGVWLKGTSPPVRLYGRALLGVKHSKVVVRISASFAARRTQGDSVIHDGVACEARTL